MFARSPILQPPNFYIHKRHPLYWDPDRVGNYCSQSRDFDATISKETRNEQGAPELDSVIDPQQLAIQVAPDLARLEASLYRFALIIVNEGIIILTKEGPKLEPQ
jgi:hypothetical protein